MLLLTLTCLAVLSWCFYGEESIAKHFLLLFFICSSAIAGARLFHVLVEKPQLLHTPQLIWQRFDGMTFYGSVILSLPLFLLIARFVYKRQSREKLFDLATLLACLSYAVLRLGCFASGCCWGKVSTLPWSVRYLDPHSVMPHLGLPVHPVQLYDSLLGFLTFAILLALYQKNKWRGQLLTLFFLAYSIERFATEFFRGDSFRGENILLTLSVSQLISFAIFCAILAHLFNKKRGEI